MSKTGIYIQNFDEKKSNKKRYILYSPVLRLENGNIVTVYKIEYYRLTNRLVLHYIDDTDDLKKIVEYLSKYYEYLEMYKKTKNELTMTQAASYLLEIKKIVETFDIVLLENNRQKILDEYKFETDLEKLAEQTQIDPTIIKSILVLDNKISLM